MRSTLANELGRVNASGWAFERASIMGPDRMKMKSAVPELGRAVRAGDAEAISELRAIILGSSTYPPHVREALIEEMASNEDLRGILDHMRRKGPQTGVQPEGALNFAGCEAAFESAIALLRAKGP